MALNPRLMKMVHAARSMYADSGEIPECDEDGDSRESDCFVSCDASTDPYPTARSPESDYAEFLSIGEEINRLDRNEWRRIYQDNIDLAVEELELLVVGVGATLTIGDVAQVADLLRRLIWTFDALADFENSAGSS